MFLKNMGKKGWLYYMDKKEVIVKNILIKISTEDKLASLTKTQQDEIKTETPLVTD